MNKRLDLNSKYPKLGNLTVPFGGQTTQEDFHPAVDIANSKGTPIKAATDGIVTNAITNRQTGENNFGNTLEFKDPEGNTHQYAHLKDVLVKPGQKIRRGQVVSTMGDTGAAYSPSGGDASNLDYRIVNAYGKYVNPTKYIKYL